MTSGGNCPVHTGDYNRDYSRQYGRGLSEPMTAVSEKVEVVAIWYSLNLLETTLAVFVTHSALYADLQLTHFPAKNYDLLRKSGTAEAYSSRPTFKSGTARPTEIGSDASGDTINVHCTYTQKLIACPLLTASQLKFTWIFCLSAQIGGV